jgi:hypothetical protein
VAPPALAGRLFDVFLDPPFDFCAGALAEAARRSRGLIYVEAGRVLIRRQRPGAATRRAVFSFLRRATQ